MVVFYSAWKCFWRQFPANFRNWYDIYTGLAHVVCIVQSDTSSDAHKQVLQWCTSATSMILWLRILTAWCIPLVSVISSNITEIWINKVACACHYYSEVDAINSCNQSSTTSDPLSSRNYWSGLWGGTSSRCWNRFWCTCTILFTNSFSIVPKHQLKQFIMCPSNSFSCAQAPT